MQGVSTSSDGFSLRTVASLLTAHEKQTRLQLQELRYREHGVHVSHTMRVHE